MIFTSLAGAMAKYCDEYVCMSVYLSVCVSVCISGTTRVIFTNFSAHAVYGRGSVLLQQSDEITRRSGNFGSFPPNECIVQYSIWQPYKNGRSDRDAVWGDSSHRP